MVLLLLVQPILDVVKSQSEYLHPSAEDQCFIKSFCGNEGLLHFLVLETLSKGYSNVCTLNRALGSQAD